jgi:hypothetical protein
MAVLVEFGKQFEATAGKDVKIEGHDCRSWDTSENFEIVFAVRLAHVNNQLATVDIQVDPARTTPTGVTTLVGVTRTSGGIIEPHHFKKSINTLNLFQSFIQYWK